MTKQLVVEHLCIYFGEECLVHDVSFTMTAGIPFTLLGRSGSGKSLIMQAIMGALPSTLVCSGRILLDGVNLADLPRHAREALWGRTMALMPQEPWRTLDPTRRAGLQVQDVFRWVRRWPHPAARDATTSALEQLDLAPHQRKYPSELSGGMCQRVAVAIAQAADATVLLADEPTKGLDDGIKQEVADGLLRIARQGKLLLTITHDVQFAQCLDGDMAVLQAGCLIETGRSNEILTAPHHGDTRRLIQADARYWPARTRRQPMAAEWLIQAQDVSHPIAGTPLFNPVSLRIHKGEITALVAASGGGKTTLGNMLIGMKKPHLGQIVRQPELQDIHIQKLYQDPPAAFIPGHSLRRLFEDLLRRHRLAEADLHYWMDRFRLPVGLLENTAEQVSGGELQRLALIRALLLKPKVLFADEATSRLDPVNQQLVMEILKELVEQEDMALILVSHDQALVQNMADQILVLEQHLPREPRLGTH